MAFNYRLFNGNSNEGLLSVGLAALDGVSSSAAASLNDKKPLARDGEKIRDDKKDLDEGKERTVN